MTTFYLTGHSMTGAVLDVSIYQKDQPSAEAEYDFRYGPLGYRRGPERGEGHPPRVGIPLPRERRRRRDAKP